MGTKTVLFKRLQIYLRNYLTRRSLRSQLHYMSRQELDSLVRDIGISSSDLFEEANKPFWSANIPKDGCETGLKPADMSLLPRYYCKYPPAA